MERTIIKKEFYNETIEESEKLRDNFIKEYTNKGYRLNSYYKNYHDYFGFCCGLEMEKIDG